MTKSYTLWKVPIQVSSFIFHANTGTPVKRVSQAAPRQHPASAGIDCASRWVLTPCWLCQMSLVVAEESMERLRHAISTMESFSCNHDTCVRGFSTSCVPHTSLRGRRSQILLTHGKCIPFQFNHHMAFNYAWGVSSNHHQVCKTLGW
jgi:hypothetical protein